MNPQFKYAAIRAGLPLLEMRDWFRLKHWPPGRDAWQVSGPLPIVGSPPFFIVGSPRSGTTLLRAIIQGHSKLFIPPENGTLGSMVKEFSLIRQKSWDQVVADVLAEFALGYEFKHWGLDLEKLADEAMQLSPSHRSLAGLIDLIYRAYGAAHAPEKPRWGDKSTPGSFHYLYRLSLVFPDALYLHIVRDGRACAASSVKAGFFDRDYLKAALAWQCNVRAAARLRSQFVPRSQFHEIRYEDLITRPEQTIESVCSFLDVELEPALLAYSEEIARRIPEISNVDHHRNVSQPLFADSLDKWKHDIPSDALRIIEKLLANDLAGHGYA